MTISGEIIYTRNIRTLGFRDIGIREEEYVTLIKELDIAEFRADVEWGRRPKSCQDGWMDVWVDG